MGPNSLKSESIIKIKFTTPGANVENIFLVVIPYTKANLENIYLNIYFFCIRPPPEWLPVLGPLEHYMTPTLDAALLCGSRAGSDLGRKSDVMDKSCSHDTRL